ncbi:MAG TPA: GntR family transcriptional regulator [Ramlibacter sp.]|nr:GntR family transcriptional regulator [Ramlibacter sp.]
MAATSAQISDRIVEAVMARKLAPGARLGEQQLAELFGCSRTIVREGLMRLAARGIVQVSARRGWFLLEPTQDEAREAFEARRVIETGLIRGTPGVDKAAVKRLQDHIALQQEAVRGPDIGTRTFLLGDFHVCLAESLGNRLLADTLRDLTARTSLVAMHYQSKQDAALSCAEHVEIVRALDAGDLPLAERLMAEHLTTWQHKLHPPQAPDPLARLRHALAPLDKAAQVLHTRTPASATKRRNRSTPQGETS